MKNRIEEEYNRREVKPIRLNKYISDAGICSRREADRLIEAGKVKIDGVTASCGMKVLPGQTVTVGKKVIQRQECHGSACGEQAGRVWCVRRTCGRRTILSVFWTIRYG